MKTESESKSERWTISNGENSVNIERDGKVLIQVLCGPGIEYGNNAQAIAKKICRVLN